ncbi:facilitated trehalose transporter Tret1 [Halyomorpha halys]|uniref:facilitated trehalose transporter Tret1 n=1 Tax=Halyomorpha halys TaxID=286706 RepID=UPI0006D4CBCA|nr:facilitated trehalose transporter Tret1-like [Halyomorpha halys]XP_014283703.1 facilitated trehalose transporter Tret1-like [Halyomorpha halys]
MSPTKNLGSSASVKGLVNDEPSYLTAYLAVIATSLLHLSNGAVMAWASPIMPQLNLTTGEKTLVGSLFSLGAAPGPFVVSFFLDLIGRKGTVYILSSTFVISWVLLLLSQNVIVIYTARIIGGIGVGGCCSGLPVVISELAINDVRGRMGSLSFFFITIGSLIVFGIGPYVGYYIMSVYGLGIVLIFLVVFFFVPESPYYYLKKGRRIDAKKNLQRLRQYATEEALEEELNEIEKAVTQEDGNVAGFWESMTTKAAKKGIGIGIFLVLMQQFAGGNPINTYCQDIFEHAKLNFPATIVPLIMTLSSLFSLVSVVVVNRCLTMKLAMLISGLGVGICLALFGLYFVLINNGVNLYDVSFISVVILFVSNLFGGLGVGPLAWPLVAEILPTSVKGIGTGICGFISSLAGFALIALFSIVSDTFGYSVSFFGIAALISIWSILSIFIVPDTSGKSLQEIQELLSK